MVIADDLEKNEKVLKIYEEEGDHITTDGEEEEVMYIKKNVLFELVAATKFKSNILNHLRNKGLIGLKHPHVPLNEITGAPLLKLNSSPSQTDFTPQVIPITTHPDPQLNPNVSTTSHIHHTSQIGSSRLNNTQQASPVNSQVDTTAISLPKLPKINQTALTALSTDTLTSLPPLLTEHHSIPCHNTISDDIANDSLSICENIEISSTPTTIICDPPIYTEEPIPSSSSSPNETGKVSVERAVSAV